MKAKKNNNQIVKKISKNKVKNIHNKNHNLNKARVKFPLKNQINKNNNKKAILKNHLKARNPPIKKVLKDNKNNNNLLLYQEEKS